MTKARNISRKRDAILEKFRSTDTHPSAEWIYNELKAEFADLSLGTVYRNISLFRQDGDIISVGTVDGQERFDAVITPHAHFICTNCGTVIDVDVKIDDNSLYQQVDDTYGVAVRTHDLTFHGLCKHCLKKQQNESEE